jgi:diguanylate cyclase (GGDEF)-like protein
MQSNHWVQEDILRGVQAKWQDLVDMLATSSCAKSCVITHWTDAGLHIVATSQNADNPLQKDQLIPHSENVFCKKVSENQEPLYVSNHDPDSSDEMIAYCGFPVFMPEGDLYGTFCIMDAKPRHDKHIIQQLVEKYRGLIEQDLALIEHLNAISEAAFTDELTGILNRRGFLLLASQQIKIALRNKKNIGLLFIDINGLKRINDVHGHQLGDAVIQAHAKQIHSCLRESELTARYGGDEFIVFVLVENPLELQAIEKRLKAAISEHKVAEGITLSASIGTSFSAADAGFELEDLIATADLEMYAIKQGKRSGLG